MSEPASGDRISELFSQALGEQVAEERRIQQVLTDVRASVFRIEELTGDSLRDTVRTSVQATAGAAVDGAIARTVGPSLAELRTALDALDRRVDDLVARLDQHSEALSALPTGVEMDAVGTSLASLRNASLTRDDVAEALRTSLPEPSEVAAPELDPEALTPIVEAVVAKHTAPAAHELRRAIAEDSEALRSHLDSRLTAHSAALEEQLGQRSSALAEAVAALHRPSGPDPLSAPEVRAIVTETVTRIVAEATADLVPEPGPAPLSATEVRAIVTEAVTRIVAEATADLVPEPGPAPLSAAEVRGIVTETVTRIVAEATADLVPEPGPAPLSAADVAAEISVGLAGLRADLGEELAELVEDQLSDLPSQATVSALAEQLATVRAELVSLADAMPAPAPPPAPLDLGAISAAVVAALPTPPPPPRAPEPVDVEAISAAVVAALPAPAAPPPAPEPVDVEAQITQVVQRVLPAAVSDAVRATELRLRAHIDEAVLALAEAVLTQPAGAPEPAPVMAQAPAVQPVTLAPAPATPVVAPVPVPMAAPTPVVPPAPAMPEPEEDEGQGKRRWFRREE